MTIKIEIFGEAKDVLKDLQALLRGGDFTTINTVTAPAEKDETAGSLLNNGEDAKKPEPEKKTRKAKEEKVAEPKAEVLAPEKPKYTLQDALDASRKYVGTPEDVAIHEPHLRKLQALNTSFGVKLVRELPAEKLEGFMAELTKLVESSATPTTNLF